MHGTTTPSSKVPHTTDHKLDHAKKAATTSKKTATPKSSHDKLDQVAFEKLGSRDLTPLLPNLSNSPRKEPKTEKIKIGMHKASLSQSKPPRPLFAGSTSTHKEVTLKPTPTFDLIEELVEDPIKINQTYNALSGSNRRNSRRQSLEGTSGNQSFSSA